MSDFTPGLEGVVAFETEIAEPDREGSALRYRGVDIEELVGHVSYGHVWGLLVDNSFEPGLPPGPQRWDQIRQDPATRVAGIAPLMMMDAKLPSTSPIQIFSGTANGGLSHTYDLLPKAGVAAAAQNRST